MDANLLLLGVVIGLAGGLATAAVLAACKVSGDIAEHERRIEALKAMGWAEFQASANGDYLTETEHDDG